MAGGFAPSAQRLKRLASAAFVRGGIVKHRGNLWRYHYECEAAEEEAEMKTETESPKFWTWHVRKELPDGMFTFCRYNATHGPVTAEHVRNSPHVREWIGEDRLDDIYHPEHSK